MSFATSILAWLHRVITSFHNRLAAVEANHGIATPALEIHPDVAAAVVEHPSAAPAIDYAAFPTPQSAYIPNGLPDGWSWDAWMAAHPGAPDPRTHTNTGDEIKPQEGPKSGTDLTFYGDVRQNVYAGPITYVFPVWAENRGAAEGFEFKWSECPGTPQGDAQVTVAVTGTDGVTYSGGGTPKIGRVLVPKAETGSTWTAVVSLSAPGPMNVQVNPA